MLPLNTLQLCFHKPLRTRFNGSSVRLIGYRLFSYQAVRCNVKSGLETDLGSQELSQYKIKINKKALQSDKKDEWPTICSTYTRSVLESKDSSDASTPKPSSTKEIGSCTLNHNIQSVIINRLPKLDITNDQSVAKEIEETKHQFRPVLSGLYAESKLFCTAALTNAENSKNWQTLAGKKNHLCFTTTQEGILPYIDTMIQDLIQYEFPTANVITIDIHILADIAMSAFCDLSSKAKLDTSLYRSCYYEVEEEEEIMDDESNTQWLSDDDSSIFKTSNLIRPKNAFQTIAFPKAIAKLATPVRLFRNGDDLSEAAAIASNDPWRDGTVKNQLRAILTSILNLPIDLAMYSGNHLDYSQEPLIIKVPQMNLLCNISNPDPSSDNYIDVIDILEELVSQRRQSGDRILMIGTISTEDPFTVNSDYSTSSEFDYFENFSVPRIKDHENALDKARLYSIMQANFRNLERSLKDRDYKITLDFSSKLHEVINDKTIIELYPQTWPIDIIERLSSTIIGSLNSNENPNIDHAMAALRTCMQNLQLFKSSALEEESEKTTSTSDTKQSSPASKLANLRRNPSELNKHELVLLNNIVDPKSIKTSFNDVRLPATTIQTVKSVVMFPLLYPQSFTYGVLGQGSIYGILLFGPPGTGKTMLAKAIAKECGASMLVVNPSDIEMKYVGESEKMVRAVFSLARKLSPCVVFLDEIDGLLNMRSSDDNSWRREMVNEFMASWEGLNTDNSGVIIIGSTNRPFDLDEAVIRRMPQRILIDLPNQEDRHAILQNILSEEDVDPDVDLLSLAKRTQDYSGSDLRNICYKAALLAIMESVSEIRDTVDANMKKRKLMNHHFESALQNIRPSLSDGMSSLTKLRSWDEKFGNGRKQSNKPIGFGNFTEQAKSPRVRPEASQGASTGGSVE